MAVVVIVGYRTIQLCVVAHFTFAVQVESGSMIAAGAVVEAGSTVASGELWAGNPARRVRELKQEEKDYLDTLPDRWAGGGG